MFTKAEIEDAEKRLLENVLRVREGDMWVEYGSPDSLRKAIEYAKAQYAVQQGETRNKTQFVSVSSGY